MRREQKRRQWWFLQDREISHSQTYVTLQGIGTVELNSGISMLTSLSRYRECRSSSRARRHKNVIAETVAILRVQAEIL